MTTKQFHLFLLAIGDVAGVEDGVVHLVAVGGGGVEIAAGGARHGTIGDRACPTAADIFVATAGLGAAGCQHAGAGNKYQESYFFHYL